ncbi:hypothetical protein [Methanolobus chelungpuianus]|uniref:ATP-grasp domain-containing protein n=1 Tax=Methanolobus chelungpuianus TaxID=502115 RepID=A0AAE3KWK6_9EURY|nr:hypothetical protein [Methanolobus chelungpuianus]MCQ6962316.1 hypothetical protein [Methanolobus chelungpuianus]
MNDAGVQEGVVVLGDHVQGLGIIRCFGRKKIPVYLVNDKGLCVGRFSRFLTGFLKSPEFNDEQGLVSYLMDIGKRKGLHKFLIIPTNDLAVRIVSKNKEILSSIYTISTPNLDAIELIYNKRRTFELAKRLGVPIPNTIFPSSVENLDTLLSDVSYPLIIKGSIGHIFYKTTGTKLFVVNSKEEILDFYQKYKGSIQPSDTIIQELIDGPTENVHSFCSFFKEGQVYAWWSGKKIRAHPMLYGTATLAESVHDPSLLEYGSRLLNAMGYYGVSEIEFKLDPRDGVFKLLEMNARTWLWVSLAIRCGVDLPYILYSDMIKNETITVDSFKVDIKWYHFYTDSAMVLREILNSRMSIKEYLSSVKGEKELAVFSTDDPLPFIAETLLLPYLWLTR